MHVADIYSVRKNNKNYVSYTVLISIYVVERITDMINLSTAEKEAIKNYIEEYNITKLYHFTRVENLASILQNGIIPIQQLKNSGVSYFNNDKMRLDRCQNANCVSIGFPNYKMFYKLRQQDVNADWVVLELDASILYNFVCAFCRSNAARYDIAAQSLNKRIGLAALDAMFDEQEHKRSNIPYYYPTDPQAEVLVFGSIPPEYIEKIYIENYSVYAEYIKNIRVRKNYVAACSVNKKLFSPRFDYRDWQRVA